MHFFYLFRRCRYARLRGVTDEEYSVIENVTNRIIEHTNKLSGRNDVIDHLAIRSTPRKGVPAHADNKKWEPSNSTWVPNGSGHRTWSAIILLNTPSEYKGGTIRFHDPNRADFLPGKGQGVIFDASEKNVHSVDTVPHGERFTFMVWLSHASGEHTRKKYFLW